MLHFKLLHFNDLNEVNRFLIMTINFIGGKKSGKQPTVFESRSKKKKKKKNVFLVIFTCKK